MGSGNQVSSLLNLNPQVNLDVSALNDIKQEASGVTGDVVNGGTQLRKSQKFKS